MSKNNITLGIRLLRMLTTSINIYEAEKMKERGEREREREIE